MRLLLLLPLLMVAVKKSLTFGSGSRESKENALWRTLQPPAGKRNIFCDAGAASRVKVLRGRLPPEQRNTARLEDAKVDAGPRGSARQLHSLHKISADVRRHCRRHRAERCGASPRAG